MQRRVSSKKRERILLLVAPEEGNRYEGHTGDALAPSADEGRGTLREARMSRVQALLIRDVRMGKPSEGHASLPFRGR